MQFLWLALLSHSKKVLVQAKFRPGIFLCGVSKFSMCLYEFSPISSQSLKSWS